MSLVNREVVHDVFGKGNVVNYDESYMKINFDSGNKRFVFPDAFKEHLKFIDEDAKKIVEEKMKIKEEELKKEAYLQAQKEAIKEEERRVEAERIRRASIKVDPKIQSVFWVEPEEEVFENWSVFTGEIKSGKKKGQPRKLARMNGYSACLITERDSDQEEEERAILGFFMAEESFDGRECEDGYIDAHPRFRVELSEKESEEMLFWNYYKDKNFPERTTWNSGRQRYFDNLWMAQILRDVLSMRKDTEEEKLMRDFFKYFCEVTQIEINEIPEANGALNHIED